MLKNAPLLVKIGVDTDENEPFQVAGSWSVVAEGWPAASRLRGFAGRDGDVPDG